MVEKDKKNIMTVNVLDNCDKLIVCKHILYGHREVKLVYLDESAVQFVCVGEDHTSYNDFHEISRKKISDYIKNLDRLKFPKSMNLATYDRTQEVWVYSVEDAENLSPVDGYAELSEYDKKTFLNAVGTISKQMGFWVVFGPSKSIGGKTLDCQKKYVCIWEHNIRKTMLNRLLSFLGMNGGQRLDFITIDEFYEKFSSSISGYSGFIIQSNSEQFVCTFDEFNRLLKK